MSNDTPKYSKFKIFLNTLGTIGGIYTVAFTMFPKLLPGYVPEHLDGAQTRVVDAQRAFQPPLSNGSGYVPQQSELENLQSGQSSETIRELRALGTSTPTDESAVRKKIADVFPKMQGKASITPLGKDSGLFKVSVVGQSFIMSADGNYLINHSYIDLSNVHTSRDQDAISVVELTEFYPRNSNQAQPRQEESSPKAIPEETGEVKKQQSPGVSDYDWLKTIAIKSPAQSEEIGEMVIFTDYTCGYCQNFHPKYDTVTSAGYTIYTVPLARTGKSGSVYSNTNKLYCSDDLAGNYEWAITHGSVRGLDLPNSCSLDFAGKAFDLVLKYKPAHIRGTPAIWFNGEKFVTISELMAIL